MYFDLHFLETSEVRLIDNTFNRLAILFFFLRFNFLYFGIFKKIHRDT